MVSSKGYDVRMRKTAPLDAALTCFCTDNGSYKYIFSANLKVEA